MLLAALFGIFTRPTGLLSIGAVGCTCASYPLAHLLEAADGALYAAKEHGRNRVVLAKLAA